MAYQGATPLPLQGITVQSLMENVGQGDIVLTGKSPSSFLQDHSGTALDFHELQTQFVKHVPDFSSDLSYDVANIAVEFCSRIIYEVGPNTRSVKKDTGDRYWKFIVMHGDVRHVLLVRTYKATTYVQKDVIHTDTSMEMTVKEAGLLAMITFSKLITIGCMNGFCIMTPLAGAVFSKLEVGKMARDYNVTIEEMLKIINASCQNGGQYLPDSNGTFAALAIYTSTRNMKDQKVRAQMCNKLIRQYINNKKPVSAEEFRKFAKYSTGGIPTELDFGSLEPEYEMARKFIPTREETKAISESTITSKGGLVYSAENLLSEVEEVQEPKVVVNVPKPRSKN